VTPLRLIGCEDTLGFERGSVVVCIPSVVADAQTLATVRGVLEHSDASAPIMLAGASASLEAIAVELVTAMQDNTVLGLAQAGGQTHVVNAAIRASSPCDLVIVAPGIRVTPGWLERLRNAAISDSTVASATPLSLGAGALELYDDDSAERFGLPAPGEPAEPSREDSVLASKGITEAALRVANRALGLRPRTTRIGPDCVYIRRAALELAGPLEEALALDRALVSLAAYLSTMGFLHVVADDVLVAGRGVAGGPCRARAEDRAQETITSDEHGSLRRAVNIARTALRRLSVTIDGRALVAAVGGTQTYLVEMVLALAHRRDVDVRVLVPPDLSDQAAEALASVPNVELLSYEQAVASPGRTDVVHRPQQVFTLDDLALLRLVGERIVIGQQDLIAYHNHTYHPDVDSWRAYRRITRLALAGADQVVFFSEHAKRDAMAEDLLAEGRAHVVGIGVQPPEVPDSACRPPDGLGAITASGAVEPFLLCLGADYWHKNRPFAIELMSALRKLGWRGRLVLAGSHVTHGSSRAREQELLSERPDLAAIVIDLGPVDEPGKRWLYAHARALVYPTLYEGFGLLPFEAARSGLPCLFAPQASLSEVADDAATLVPWDAHASATAVLALLCDGPARDEHLARLRRLSSIDWKEVANRLLAVYERALLAPPSEAAPRVWQELDRERYIISLDGDVGRLREIAQEYQDAYRSLQARTSFGLPLIDEGGLLSAAQQRGLMRIASRGRLGALVLAPLGLLGRLGRGRRLGAHRH
jgi:glycosyltransferase involved in cell wall biosynthesis